MKRILQVIVLLLAFFSGWPAQAKLEIEIIQGNAAALPIAVVPFQWRAAGPPPITGVAEVIASDLYRSGLFAPLDEADMVAAHDRLPGHRLGGRSAGRQWL